MGCILLAIGVDPRGGMGNQLYTAPDVAGLRFDICYHPSNGSGGNTIFSADVTFLKTSAYVTAKRVIGQATVGIAHSAPWRRKKIVRYAL